MNDYMHPEITVTIFKAEDVITTSGAPSDSGKSYSIAVPTIKMNNLSAAGTGRCGSDKKVNSFSILFAAAGAKIR